MPDRLIPVPESLIERAKDALIEVPPSSRNADIYGELHALLSQPEPSAEPECACYPVPEHLHTTHYGATDPASMWEPNPDCPVHFPAAPPSIADMAPEGKS